MESVPTTVVWGSKDDNKADKEDGGVLYVGELTGFPFPVGGARIYRVVGAGP